MKQKGVGEEQAYRVMRKLAMDRNAKLLDIAQQIIDVAECSAECDERPVRHWCKSRAFAHERWCSAACSPDASRIGDRSKWRTNQRLSAEFAHGMEFAKS